MTMDQNLGLRDNFCYALRFAPPHLANGNSRFCFFKVTKPADEHLLQVYPDRFANLFASPNGL
jgi:hypothetical protein